MRRRLAARSHSSPGQRRRSSPSLLLGAAGLLAVAGCGGEPEPFHGFEDVAPELGLLQATHSGSAAKVHIRESLGQGLCWLDSDHDGDADLLVLNGAREVRPDYAGEEALFEPWRFYENQGGRLEERTAGSGLDVAAWGIGCATGDVDGDGLTDLFVTTAAGPNRLFSNQGRRFVERTRESGVGALELSASAAFGDLDADGDLDLFLANGHVFPEVDAGDPSTSYRQPFQLLFNNGAGRFQEAPERLRDNAPAAGRGAATADFDGDGDLDVAATRDGEPPRLWRNALPAGSARWLRVRLRGRGANTAALGGRVVLESAGGRRQLREIRANRVYLSASEPVASFGLGETGGATRLTVRWPGGRTRILLAPPVDRELVLPEPAAAR